jgi:hypothetical protein
MSIKNTNSEFETSMDNMTEADTKKNQSQRPYSQNLRNAQRQIPFLEGDEECGPSVSYWLDKYLKEPDVTSADDKTLKEINKMFKEGYRMMKMASMRLETFMEDTQDPN